MKLSDIYFGVKFEEVKQMKCFENYFCEKWIYVYGNYE